MSLVEQFPYRDRNPYSAGASSGKPLSPHAHSPPAAASQAGILAPCQGTLPAGAWNLGSGTLGAAGSRSGAAAAATISRSVQYSKTAPL